MNPNTPRSAPPSLWSHGLIWLHCGLLLNVASLNVKEISAQTIIGKPIHLRNGSEPEWSSFPDQPNAARLDQEFAVTTDSGEATLWIQQNDVKQTWQVWLNDQQLGQLVRNENHMLVPFAVPARLLRPTGNRLSIRTRSDSPDDITVGPARVVSGSPGTLLAESGIQVRIIDKATGRIVPGRLTVTDSDGVLQSTGTVADSRTAVRPGVIYCLGNAELRLPAGSYRIHAGRGFEWSLATTSIQIGPGDVEKLDLIIEREVNTVGWVACDTHVHTLTHSGHGDATVAERMITLAGEGIELPIATDHNKHIDYRPASRTASTEGFFTPLIGNEFTTRLGHFNLFPVQGGSAIPDSSRDNWEELFDEIQQTPGVRVAILNHPRDVHSGFRPFGPAHHLAVAGHNLDGWQLQANAVEVVNSAAQQSDLMQLVTDWMGLLNAGHRMTPVGCSDSHDVARHFVGQARTYVRVDDRDPGAIDTAKAVERFLEGQVMVSCGLLVHLQVESPQPGGTAAGPGELGSARNGMVRATVTVSAPSWIPPVESIELYQNGHRIHVTDGRFTKDPEGIRGRRFQTTVTLRKLTHDVALVAVAHGPGVRGLHWPIAKPYQPTSPQWEPRVIGVSGSVFVDVNENSRFDPAAKIAADLVKRTRTSAERIKELNGMDQSVAVQTAWLLHQAPSELSTKNWMRTLAESGKPHVQAGFAKVANGLREHARAVLDREP